MMRADSWSTTEHRDAYFKGFNDARRGKDSAPPDGRLRDEYLCGWNRRKGMDAERHLPELEQW
jgi:hypothetical protein